MTHAPYEKAPQRKDETRIQRESRFLGLYLNLLGIARRYETKRDRLMTLRATLVDITPSSEERRRLVQNQISDFDRGIKRSEGRASHVRAKAESIKLPTYWRADRDLDVR